MRAIASGRLAVAPDPVSGDRQHERRQAELAERRGVDEQPGEEAARRTDDRTAEKRDGDERHEQDVRHATEHVHLREDRHLHDRRDEEKRGGLEAVDDVHGSCRGALRRDEGGDGVERVRATRTAPPAR